MNKATNRQTLYYKMGGESSLKALVETFYDIVETDPDGEPVHVLHLQGFGVNHLRQAQFEFLSGFFGGPQLYIEKTGHSNLRLMHEHVEIGAVERDSWLLCMEKAIDKVGFEAEIKDQLMQGFTRSAEVLKNRD
ncbi:MAG: group II truncated hemoglobin [Arenicella sp.]